MDEAGVPQKAAQEIIGQDHAKHGAKHTRIALEYLSSKHSTHSYSSGRSKGDGVDVLTVMLDVEQEVQKQKTTIRSREELRTCVFLGGKGEGLLKELDRDRECVCVCSQECG